MRLVSYCTPSYWPGLKVLAHSLRVRGNLPKLDWIVATEKPAPSEWGDWLYDCAFNMVNPSFSDLSPLPDPLPPTQVQFVSNWVKLRLFDLPAGEYTYLDVDMLCMGDASELLTMPSVSAVSRSPESDWVSNGINAGFIRFDADKRLFYECMRIASHAGRMGQYLNMGEQDVINIALQEQPELLQRNLDSRWNMPTKAPPERLAKAIFLHFVGMVKPWNQGDDERGKIWRDYRHDHRIWL